MTPTTASGGIEVKGQLLPDYGEFFETKVDFDCQVTRHELPTNNRTLS